LLEINGWLLATDESGLTRNQMALSRPNQISRLAQEKAIKNRTCHDDIQEA
jgi:hypothetical protein